MGEKSHFSSLAHALSSAVYMQGRYDEAEQLTRECEEATRPNDVHSQIIWRSIRAKTLARTGRFEAAEPLAGEAGRSCRHKRLYPAHADALIDLAEVLTLAGSSERRPHQLPGKQLASTSSKATCSQPRGRAYSSRGSASAVSHNVTPVSR